MNRYQHIQQEAFEANMQLPALGLVLFTFGNVSAADRQLGVFAIKPSGVPYKELAPEKMIIVDFEGKQQIRKDTPALKASIIKKHYERKHGPGSYYGQ